MNTEIDKNDKFGCTLIIETDGENPVVVTDKTRIQPSEFILKGSQKYKKNGEPVPGVFNKLNLWILKIDKQSSERGLYLNFAIELMLDILDKRENEFLEIFDKFPKYHLTCYAYFYDFNPYFSLSKELMRRLNKYNIDIEFDLYYLTD